MPHTDLQKKNPLAFCTENTAALCLFLLCATFSACSSSRTGSNEESLHGIRTVSFDKNGGDTEAEPASIALRPPATTLETLPEEPTRAGHRFAGWNTERDGSGSPFTTSSPLSSILTIVYAQWEPRLGLHLSRESFHFSPLKDGAYDERSADFTVTVSGLKNAEAASGVQLDIVTDTQGEPLWFWLQDKGSHFSGNAKTFSFHVRYQGTSPEFSESPATLHFRLRSVPPGHEYANPPHTLQLAALHGREGRPLRVHRGNIVHFNRYANTDEGLGLHYQLVENVTLSPLIPEEKSNWVPIGSTEAKAFAGSFDGGGFHISGLEIDAPAADEQGMFGALGAGATLKNLGLEGGSVQGNLRVGSLVGWNGGTVDNCYATGDVRGIQRVGGLVGWNEGTVDNSHATGDVNGGSTAGGLVGRNEGLVRNSHAAGDVSGTNNNSNNVGGLVGESTGTVENSYATGSVKGNGSVGGLVGRNNGTLENSYATGNVDGNGSVGGVAGTNIAGATDSGAVRNCYATGNVSGSDHVGGVVGWNNGTRSTVKDSHATGDVSGTGFYVGGVVGDNSGAVHSCYATGNVSGTSRYVGGVAGGNSGSVEQSYATGDVSSTNSDVGGVVGENSGAVEKSYATGSVQGSSTVGGVVGRNNSNRSTLKESYATGNVSGINSAVGGVVGRNEGGVHNCYAKGNVNGNFAVGGVAGWNRSTVHNCYAMGDVTNTGSHTGGLVGMNEGDVRNCYATGNVWGDGDYAGGLTGYGTTPTNCVALNPSVTKIHLNSPNLGRVTGGGGNAVSRNNYAREDMKLNGNAFLNVAPHGKDVSAEEYGKQPFWAGVFEDFELHWEWGPTQLPILKSVGGEQRPEVQPVP